jgi:hypothetical protein
MASWIGPGELLELEEDGHLAEMVSDWDFRRGKEFEQAIFSRYKSSVHHSSSSPRGAFFLLAVFHHYTFRLSTSSVSLALHACVGGSPAGFHVNLVQDRHFCFTVASKVVGFAVTDLKRITTPHFDVYFHLWVMVVQTGIGSLGNGKKRKMSRGSWSRKRKAQRGFPLLVSLTSHLRSGNLLRRSLGTEFNLEFSPGSFFKLKFESHPRGGI